MSEVDLRSYLEHAAVLFGHRGGLLYRGPADFVLQHGRLFLVGPYPPKFWRGAPLMCYGNSIMVAVATGLPYVEGYACPPAGLGPPVLHAWNVDARGRVLDTTWRNVGTVYLGVEFALGRADDCTWNGDANVLDDCHRGWPLLRSPWDGEPPGLEWPPSEALTLARKVGANDPRFRLPALT